MRISLSTLVILETTEYVGEALDLLRTSSKSYDYECWMLMPKASWTWEPSSVAPGNACHASVVHHEDVNNDDDAKTTRRNTLVDDSAGDRIDGVATAAVVAVAAASVSGNFSRAFQR